MGMKESNTGGEIVQVEGGHIMRATGRKDRHSKVVTAKGARDRRVRLSAHTAIQFYDVQDRLGYDRPSKAVDWLIKKAKASIDKLIELPPFDPTSGGIGANSYYSADLNVGDGSNYDMTMTDHCSESSDYALQIRIPNGTGNDNNSYVPQPPVHSDLSDTMKTLFSMSNNNSSNGAGGNSIGFHDLYRHQDNNHTQDLCLSLQSFQDHQQAAGLIHGSSHYQESTNLPHSASDDHHQSTIFSLNSGAMASFEPNSSGGWGHHEHQPPGANTGRFSRLLAWSSTNGSSCSGNAGLHGGDGDEEDKFHF